MNKNREKIKIHINLAGRQYPIKVLPEQEEIIRKAGKFLENRNLLYQHNLINY